MHVNWIVSWDVKKKYGNSYDLLYKARRLSLGSGFIDSRYAEGLTQNAVDVFFCYSMSSPLKMHENARFSTIVLVSNLNDCSGRCAVPSKETHTSWSKKQTE